MKTLIPTRLIAAVALCGFVSTAHGQAHPAAADYVVNQGDSGEIVARSGIDGTMVASGADAATVIQAAIDRLPVTGGKVYVAAGSYELTRTIKIEDKHGVHLEGAARGILFSGGRDPHNVIITSVHAYNNKHAGIHVERGEHVVIAQCICSGHDHVAVGNHGQPYGIHVGPECRDVVVEGNIAHGNGEQGILVESQDAQAGE